MLTLSDLNNTQKPQLSELSPAPEVSQVFNSGTINNMAAHAALLADPTSILKTYSTINTELTNGTSSPTMDALLKQNSTLEQSADYAELQKILRDPEISNDDKQQYMSGYVNSVSVPQDRSLSVLVGQAANAQIIGPDENDETTETTVFDLGTTLDEADAYRGWVQSAINTQTSLKDRDGFNLILDVVESLVPFMDQAAVAKSRLASGGNLGDMFKSLALMGDSKAEMRAAIAKMPVADRYKFAQKLIDVVKGTGGSFTIRPNELSVVNQLNTYLVSGTYGDGDKFLDNVFSLTDIVFPVSGWIGKTMKGARAAKEAAIVSERGAQAEARLSKASVAPVGDAPPEAVALPQAGNVVEDALTLRGKTLSPTAPLSKPGELAPMANPIIRDLNLTPKGGRRDATEYEGGFVGPEKPVMDQLDDIAQESVVNRVSVVHPIDHTSVSQTLKDANPGKARAANALIEADKSDNVAKVLAGTTRKDAIANDRLGEVAAPNGVVRNKVEMDDVASDADQRVVNSVIQDQGMIHIPEKQKILTRGKVKDAFRDVVGLVPRRAMATIGRDVDEALDTARGVAFDMIYGPKDGGFADARQGIQQVLVGLKKYGVKGDEVEILVRGANGLYAPVKGVPTAKGNYLIRVKYNYEFGVGDPVGNTLYGGSKWNFFDSRTNITEDSAGSILEHIVPAFSRIDAILFNSASAASDMSAKIGKQLLELGKVYAQKYKKLSKRQKVLLDLYRIEANEKGIKFSVSNLRARGFDEDTIETMRSWKVATDTMYELENIDLNKTLRLRGWERLVDQTNDTDLIVKSVPNRGFADGVKAYDLDTNTIREFSKAEIDELYSKGGNIAESRSKVRVSGGVTSNVIVRQNAEGSYTRAIRDSDRTLSYRDGYYPVRYTDPIFITKRYKDVDGSMVTETIATAGTHNDAAQLLARLRQTDTVSEYNSRPNLRKGTQEFEDNEWSSLTSGGRSTQRIRGERLENTSRQTDLNHAHVESPEESLVNSIRSLAARTSFRDWAESSKANWMAQYGDLLEDVDGFKKLWPNSKKSIGRLNLEESSQRIKDAKATWSYINSMENGYVNLIDDLAKNFLRNMATDIGKGSWKWLDNIPGSRQTVEKFIGAASDGSPSQFARRRAFRLMLAANPLRQLPVQAMQALPVLLATNPLAIPKISMQMVLLDYLKNGGDADSLMKVVANKMTGMDAASAKQLAKDWEASGFEASVDAHTLVRNQMSSLVDRTWWDRAKGIVGTPIDFLQKKGFNAGETILMRSIWLSEYDLARKAGKKLDADGLQQLNARVRNLTLNMNKAGELPYNQNALSSFMQFFQAPHKAFAQVVFGHKGLSGSDRIRLGTSYVLVYGTGAGWLSETVMNGIEALFGKVEPETRDLIEGGLFNLAVNNALSTLFEKDVNIDFSDSLRIVNQPDFMFWQGLLDSEVSEVLSNSASASLVLGGNPRITNFVKQMMRPFVVDWDKKPEELYLTGKSFLTIFSGMSNAFKAMYALEFERSMSAKGRTIDYHVNDIEAFAKFADFNTRDEVLQYAFDEESYKKSGKYKEDIKTLIDETSSRLAAKGIGNEEAGWYMDMMAEAQKVYKNDPFYMQEFANQIKYKALAGENSIYLRLREMSGWMDKSEFIKLVSTHPQLTDDAKKTLLDSVNIIGAN